MLLKYIERGNREKGRVHWWNLSLKSKVKDINLFWFYHKRKEGNLDMLLKHTERGHQKIMASTFWNLSLGKIVKDPSMRQALHQLVVLDISNSFECLSQLCPSLNLVLSLRMEILNFKYLSIDHFKNSLRQIDILCEILARLNPLS